MKEYDEMYQEDMTPSYLKDPYPLPKNIPSRDKIMKIRADEEICKAEIVETSVSIKTKKKGHVAEK